MSTRLWPGWSKGSGLKYKTERAPKNKAELEFYDYAKNRGWELSKRGYPDFACFTEGGELIFVEVKRKRSHALKRSQLFLMTKLAERGIRCYRWSPDGGFEEIVPPRKDI